MFGSKFGWYTFCCCLHVGIGEVFIFVIQSKCFGYLLKSIGFFLVLSYIKFILFHFLFFFIFLFVFKVSAGKI